MSESRLIGPDGKPIPVEHCIRFEGHDIPYRVVSPDQLMHKDARIGMAGLLTQVGDQHNAIWLAMYCLARDIYAHSGSVDHKKNREDRYFQDFAEAVKLVIVDANKEELNIAAELKKV